MKRFTLLFLFAVTALPLYAQNASLKQVPQRTPLTQLAGTQVCAPGSAAALLDVNNVRARVFNTGGLFWRGGMPMYEVPKGSDKHSMFAAGLWMGGMVGETLHFAGSDYGPYEFWPGPLDAQGQAPDDCTPFDRIYRITPQEIRAFEEDGILSDDLRDWPWQLGAPVEDGDGNPDNYDLAAGDRPTLIGHQTLWWVMNDRGGQHGWSQSPALGVEVQVTAFAVSNTASVLDETTYYTYKLINKSGTLITDFYFGLWADADLGNAADDFVGSDPDLDLGYIYNGTANDQGSTGYGVQPPALGITVVEGPLADTDGVDNDGDGAADEPGERQGLSTFLVYQNTATVMGNPFGGADGYNYLKGLWRDEVPITFGGQGRDFSDNRAHFMYANDPPAFWSEENLDDAGTGNSPGDRRFVMALSGGDFAPGAEKEITLALVWAQGVDRLDSIQRMKEGVVEARAAFEGGLMVQAPQAPTVAPRLLAPGNGAIGQPTDLLMVWTGQDPAPTDFQVQLSRNEAFTDLIETRVVFSNAFQPVLTTNQTYFWRVQPVNISGSGPWSEIRSFSTGAGGLRSAGPLQINADALAFVEVVGPGGADPCGPDATSTFGCAEVGGNFVYPSLNGTGTYLMSSQNVGPEQVLSNFAPSDFEIRFTAGGSYGLHVFTTGAAMWVPFEMWDIGPTGPFNVNDPSDDVRLIPILFSDQGGECTYEYGEITLALDGQFERPATDRMYAYYPGTGLTYEDWATAAGTLVDADPIGCPAAPLTDDAINLIDFGKGRPLQRIVFADNVDANQDGIYDGTVADLEGTVVRFYTAKLLSQAPVPSNPADGAQLEMSDVDLYWYSPPNLAAHDLQVATDAAFATLLVDVQGLTESRFALADLQSGQSYYWRVRGKTQSGEVGAWSPVSQFQVLITTDTEAALAGIPQTYQLKRNYPNPFNPSTQIVYGLPEAAEVRISIHDVLGRRVATLTQERQPAGWHTATWEAHGFSSGVYVYRMEAGPFQATQKMMLVK